MLYHSVTAEIQRLSNPGWRYWEFHPWVQVLIDEFWKERNAWPESPLDTSSRATKDYFSAASRLRMQILRVTSCAFLHICYDLPRVIANEWPGKGRWIDGPNEITAEGAYTALEAVFPTVFASAIKRRDVVGWWGIFLGRIPETLIRISACWIYRLRLAAWNHGRVLQAAPNRQFIETQMLRAVTASIRHVEDLKPWRVGLLGPPNEAVFGLSELAAISTFMSVSYGLIATLAAMLILFVIHVLRLRRDLVEAMKYIDELGRRMLDYVEFAVTEPEGLGQYLQRHDPKNTFRKE